MPDDRQKQVIGAIAVFVFILFFVILAIAGHEAASRRHASKKEFGKIYRSGDGHYYTRSHDSSGFSDWEYVGGDAGGDDSGSLRGGSWTRVSSPPSGMTATSKVVEEEGGKPASEVEEESAETNADEITESTTESEADGMDSAADSTSDSGSDSGGDSGGDGGGDGGGGDGGGGGSD